MHRHPEGTQANTAKQSTFPSSNQHQAGPSRAPAPYTPYYGTHSTTPAPRSNSEAKKAEANKSYTQLGKRDGSSRDEDESEETARRRRLAREEDALLMREAAGRVAQALLADQIAVTFPDYKTPFRDAADAVQRLLPYHVFQQPDEDLLPPRPSINGKGKQKADETLQALREDIAETEMALGFFKRRKALQEKFRAIRMREGTRPAPIEQTYQVYSLVVDADRKHNNALTAEMRVVRDEVARLEKEQRQPYRPYHGPQRQESTTPTSTQPPARIGNSYIPYHPPLGTVERIPISSAEIQARAGMEYRTNPAAPPRASQARRQTGTPPPRASVPPVPQTQSQSQSQPQSQTLQTPTAPHGPQQTHVPTHPIPIQIPATALAALDTLGILPTPVASLPPSNQPQPATVLMGARDGGQTLDITINLSLLDQAQLSGLAAVLNLLKTSGVSLQSGRAGTQAQAHQQPSQPQPPQSSQPPARSQADERTAQARDGSHGEGDTIDVVGS